MRLAIVSDVHSNLHALKAVRNEIQRARADMVVCAGDTIGYGAYPNECCRIIKELAQPTVLGNHDIAAITKVTTWMNPFAAEAALWTANTLSADSREFIQSCPDGITFEAGTAKIAMFHGSPKSVDEYIYEEDAKAGLFAHQEAPIMILGHTHVPFIKRLGKNFILNPGAVGQPRDGDPRASFALMETSDATCEIRRVEYDIDGAADAIISVGLPAFLAQRLFQGT